jgi:hypothetical protein
MSFKGATPTTEEVERIRLLLSTYQDGMGQLTLKGKEGTLPNWRDFERSVAIALNGQANESKTFFDVVVPIPDESKTHFGISCKMRGLLNEVTTKNHIVVEVSNAAKDFWKAVEKAGINTTSEMVGQEKEAGQAILGLVESWHSQWGKFKIDLAQSYYLILQYNTKTLEFQLFQLPLEIPPASAFKWSIRVGEGEKKSKTLVGNKNGRDVIEWYPDSGGQLKYFPHVTDAIWQSHVFKLEALPENRLGYGIKQKAIAYFPELWQLVDKQLTAEEEIIKNVVTNEAND